MLRELTSSANADQTGLESSHPIAGMFTHLDFQMLLFHCLYCSFEIDDVCRLTYDMEN